MAEEKIYLNNGELPKRQGYGDLPIRFSSNKFWEQFSQMTASGSQFPASNLLIPGRC